MVWAMTADDGDAASVAKPVVGIAVNPEQAIVIGAIMKNLPHDLDPKLVDTCEAELIKLAAVYEPTLLRHQGEKILDYIAPEIADEALEAKLNREEAAARRKRAFSIRDNGNGSHSIWGHLDTESATILKSAIDPLAKPIPAGTAGERDQRLPEQRRADALIDVCRLALQADTLPDNGGQRPQLNVTVKYDVLTKELSAGTLDIGGQLSPTTVRRLACDALILPAVLGNRGEVLDLGRQRRLYTGAVRRAIILRDGGCAFPGCDRPPTWCQVHHLEAVAHRRNDLRRRRTPALLAPPSHRAPAGRVGDHPRHRRTVLLQTTAVRGPGPTTTTQPLPHEDIDQPKHKINTRHVLARAQRMPSPRGYDASTMRV